MAEFKDLFAETHADLLLVENQGMVGRFKEHFGLEPGDYLEMSTDGAPWRPYRILGVRNCYPNQSGGYTASLKVMALLVSGRMGVGRHLTLFVNRGGTLRGMSKPNSETVVRVRGKQLPLGGSPSPYKKGEYPPIGPDGVRNYYPDDDKVETSV